MATIAELLAQHQHLQAVSDSPLLDVELLLCHCLQKPRSYLRAWPEAQIPVDAEHGFQKLLRRRQRGEPVAYLTGERGFWSLDLTVNSATLIPRPETEMLVEKSLDLLADNAKASVLDLGTGSGAIALALAAERPQWRIAACDRESAAVALAETNRRRYMLHNVSIFQSDWFAEVDSQRFDLIVSNPPYIDPEDPHLQRGDLRFEPRSALVAGRQGLADIEHIIGTAGAFLHHRAWLLFEHGYNQAEAARSLLLRAGFSEVFTDRDLAGLDRISGGRFCRPGPGVDEQRGSGL